MAPTDPASRFFEPNRQDETIDLSVDQGARASEAEGQPKASSSADRRPVLSTRPVEVVSDHASLTEETRALLQVRLQATAILLLCGFGLFLIRNLVLYGVRADLLRMLHVAVIGVQLATIAALSIRWTWTIGRLRWIEALLFGSALFYFTILQYMDTAQQIERGDAVVRRALVTDEPTTIETVAALTRVTASLVARVKNSIVFTLILMMIYGLLIPNSRQRTSVAVGIVLLVSSMTQLLTMRVTQDQHALVDLVATPEIISENLMLLFIGAFISVYGSYIINKLRIQVFEARRLGQYVLKRPLGSGGMGAVYLAEHQMLKRPCAIKLIQPHRSSDLTALERFEREVRSTARLSHWNTIEIYDYGRTEDGTFYYVMEYLRGLSLADLVTRYGPLPPGRVIYLLAQACDALAEAHAFGLIHRDLKPGNLFAVLRGGQSDVTKVLDFGLVLAIGPTGPNNDTNQQRQITGTHLYMSPEQAQGLQRLDPRSDLFSLGAVAYTLLTGNAPHSGHSTMQVLSAVIRHQPKPPSAIQPTVAEDLDRVVQRCMAKRAADRFASARDLAQALRSCRQAGEWDADRAFDWWRAFEPQVFEPVTQPG